MLEETGKVKKLRQVAEAKVPVLTMKIGSTKVDLLYACFPGSVELCEPSRLDERAHLRKFDSVSLKSISGCRDGEAILRSLPPVPGLPAFQILLRAIKYWAKQRCIYSNGLGFLGGFSWAVLAAYVCSTYKPNAGPSTSTGPSGREEELLSHFFTTFAEWGWPEIVAITRESAKYRFNPKTDLMPIITPTPPYSNSARNISRSTLSYIQEEFYRGVQIMKNWTSDKDWEILCERPNFFREFEAYIVIHIQSLSKDELRKCVGWTEGHIIGVVFALEQNHPMAYVVPMATPFINLQDQISAESRKVTKEKTTKAKQQNAIKAISSNFPFTGTFFIGLQKSDNPEAAEACLAKMDINGAMANFKNSFDNWAGKPQGNIVELTLVKRAKIVRLVPKSWMPEKHTVNAS